jgi:hypothetical protein
MRSSLRSAFPYDSDRLSAGGLVRRLKLGRDFLRVVAVAAGEICKPWIPQDIALRFDVHVGFRDTVVVHARECLQIAKTV